MSSTRRPLTNQKITRDSTRRFIVVTGGAGFIGANLAARLLTMGERVLIYDALSRPGVEANLNWLSNRFRNTVEIVAGDVCDSRLMRECLREASFVYHFAAQVAVTTSFDSPTADFNTNAGGALNVLESIRALRRPIPLLFTSTNKVYGGLRDLSLTTRESRYLALDDSGIPIALDESRPLDPESPYGCSKAAADQYVRDYARSMHIPAMVFRMSCIYGPRQQGTEDQGWIAHFVRSALDNRSITIYGDGRQVRDALYIDDLVDAMLAARRKADRLSGRAFNIGGGRANTVSILELVRILRDILGVTLSLKYAQWRPGDQFYYVSDTSAFGRETGWAPRTAVRDGVALLCGWLRSNQAPQAAMSAPSLNLESS